MTASRSMRFVRALVVTSTLAATACAQAVTPGTGGCAPSSCPPGRPDNATSCTVMPTACNYPGTDTLMVSCACVAADASCNGHWLCYWEATGPLAPPELA